MLIRGRDRITEPSLHGTPKQVYLRGGVLPAVTQVAVVALAEGFEAELHRHPTMFENYYSSSTVGCRRSPQPTDSADDHGRKTRNVVTRIAA
jgi:hypothetical protein